MAGIFQEKTPRKVAVPAASPAMLPGVGNGTGGKLQDSDCRSCVQHCPVSHPSRLSRILHLINKFDFLCLFHVVGSEAC